MHPLVNIFLCVTCLVGGVVPVVPAAEESPTNAVERVIAPMPSAYPRGVPGEDPILGVEREMLPGVGVLQFEPNRSTINYATSASVGDGAGLYVSASLDRIALLGLYKTGVRVDETQNDVQRFNGVSFWVKGDGSSADGLIGIGPGLQHRYRFSLADTSWRKQFVPWEAFTPPVTGDRPVPVFVLGILPPQQNEDFYYLQQVESYEEDYTTGRKTMRQRVPITATQVLPYRSVLLEYDQLDVDGSDGLMIRVFGSGGPAMGSVQWAFSDQPPFTFPLSFNGAREYYIEWKDLPPPLDVAVGRRVLKFQVGSSISGKHFMTLDRLHYYTNRIVENIQPTPETQAYAPIPTKRFYTGEEHLQPVLDLLKNRRRLTVVTVGDEVMQGYGVGFLEQNFSYLYRQSYWFAFAQRLAREYRYRDDLRIFYEVYSEREQQWTPVTKAMSDRSRLNVIAMGNNGTTVDFVARQLDRIATYQPHVLLLQYGTNDQLYGTPEVYKESLEKVLQWATEQEVLVILGVPPPIADGTPHPHLEGENYWHRGQGFAEVCRELATRYPCVVVDTRAAFEAEGSHRIGDYFTSARQLNHRGHHLLEQLYTGLFSSSPVEVRTDPGPRLEPVTDAQDFSTGAINSRSSDARSR